MSPEERSGTRVDKDEPRVPREDDIDDQCTSKETVYMYKRINPT